MSFQSLAVGQHADTKAGDVRRNVHSPDRLVTPADLGTPTLYHAFHRGFELDRESISSMFTL